MPKILKHAFDLGAALLLLISASGLLALSVRPAQAQVVDCTSNDYPGGPIVSGAWLSCGTHAMAGPSSV